MEKCYKCLLLEWKAAAWVEPVLNIQETIGISGPLYKSIERTWLIWFRDPCEVFMKVYWLTCGSVMHKMQKLLWSQLWMQWSCRQWIAVFPIFLVLVWKCMLLGSMQSSMAKLGLHKWKEFASSLPKNCMRRKYKCNIPPLQLTWQHQNPRFWYMYQNQIYIVTIALLYLDVCVYISTIYIFIILLSRNNVFMWLKHSCSPQFQIYSHISDFAHGLLSGSGVEWESLQWAGSCASLQLELVLCSHGAGTFQQSPRHSCSGRSSHLHLALESLSRGRAITTYSAAFGLFLSKELLKDISYYSSVLWPWHTVYSQTVFLVSCCLMHQNFLLMYSVWPISFIAAEIGPYVIRKVLSFPSLNPDNCKLYFSCFGLRGRGGFVNAYLLCVIRWCFCNVLWDLGLGGATQSQ